MYLVAIFSLCPPTPCIKPVKERYAGGIALSAFAPGTLKKIYCATFESSRETLFVLEEDPNLQLRELCPSF